MRAALEIGAGDRSRRAGVNALEESRRAWEFDPKQSRDSGARKERQPLGVGIHAVEGAQSECTGPDVDVQIKRS
jgi:hypothetical protein